VHACNSPEHVGKVLLISRRDRRPCTEHGRDLSIDTRWEGNDAIAMKPRARNTVQGFTRDQRLRHDSGELCGIPGVEGVRLRNT
jgi:hypothetical protein